MTHSATPRHLWGCLHANLLCLAALFFSLSATAEPLSPMKEPTYTRIQAGHSAMWYDPARSGEGWMLEVLPDDGAVVYWFTFDDEGNPRWLTAGGQIRRGDSGDEIHFDSLIAVHGPRFGPDFDPEDAVREDKGSAIFRFHDCDSGEIHFDAYGHQASYPLTRLTRTMGANGCRPIHGTPGEPVQPYAGQSGSWYDPASSGQGFSLGWMANGDAALVWFTFDADGKPYWLTATGKPEDEGILFEQLFAVHGGRFADAFDPDDVIRTPWGRLEMTLECDTGQASYFPTDEGFSEGQFNLKKLTKLESPVCPWVKPKLTDLYDFEWTELPVPEYTTPLNPVNFEMTSIADDGTVVGGGRWGGWTGVVRLRPGESEWEKMLEGGGNPRISPDGRTIYASRNIPAPPEDRYRVEYSETMIWQDGIGWQVLPGAVYPNNSNIEISQNGEWVVGTGYLTNDLRSYPWKWNKKNGQSTLVVSEEIRGGDPIGISNDGNMVLGYTMRLIGTTPRAVAINWENDSPPKIIRDANVEREGAGELFHAWACDAACKVIVGFEWFIPEIDKPESYSAWYYTGKGDVVYIPHPTSGLLPGQIGARDINLAGDLIVGNYAAHHSGPYYISEGWLWTQDTGTVDLRDILEGNGDYQFTDRWNRGLRDISANGENILFTGFIAESNSSLHQFRAGVLRLIPRASKGTPVRPIKE